MKPSDLPPDAYLRWGVADERNVRLYARGRREHAACFARLRADVLRSRTVIFDAPAAEVVGRVAALSPTDMLRAAASARLPWSSAALIINFPAYLKAATANGAEGDGPGPTYDGDDRNQAYVLLITLSDDSGCRGTVSSLGQMQLRETRALKGMTVEPVGLRFDFSGLVAPRPDPECRALVRREIKTTLEIAERQTREQPDFKWTPGAETFFRMIMDRPMEDIFSLGMGFVPMPESIPQEGWRPVLQEALARIDVVAGMLTPVWSPYCAPKTLDPSMLTSNIAGMRGIGRMVLALLAVLGESGVTTYEQGAPSPARMVGSWRVPRMKTSHARIDLSRLTLLRHPGSDRGPAGLRVEHQVRGHWVHYLRRGAGSCAHQWQAVGDAGVRQECACGAFRRWRSEHVRGSAAKGYAFVAPVEVTA